MTIRGLQPQLQESLGGAIGQSFGQADRLFEMGNRLVIGRSIQRPVPRLEPPFDGRLAKSRLREMMSDELRLSLGYCWKPISQGVGNAPMQHLPAALEQVLVGRVLHQGVFKAEDGLRWIPAPEQELCILELGEGVSQCRFLASQ